MRLECFHCGKESHSESVLSPAQAPSLHIPSFELGVSFLLLLPTCTCLCHCHSTDTTAGLCSGAFWRSLDTALPAGSETSKTSQRPNKYAKEKPSLAWAEPVRWMRACSGVGLWQEELETGAEDASGCKKSALELCWLLGQAPPALQNSALSFTGKQTKPKCEHFRGQSGNNGMSTGGV